MEKSTFDVFLILKRIYKNMITERSRWRFINENRDEELISMTRALYADIIIKLSEDKSVFNTVIEVLINDVDEFNKDNIKTPEQLRAILIDLSDVTLEKIMLKIV